MGIEDIKELGEAAKRVFDCLDRGISSLLSPFAYKRMERAKLLIEQERSNQNAIIALKDAMTQDMIKVARTTRDKNEIHNIADIYGSAIVELQSIDPSKLPAQKPSNEWAAHFYDCVKDCSDEEVKVMWSKILAGEIQSPGKYYKRTLTNLKQIEKHEAEWFVTLCKYTIANSYVPSFATSKDMFPFNQFQSLVDCGFINANEGIWEIYGSCVLPLKSKRLKVELKDKIFKLNIYTLTDTGTQICDLVNAETDERFLNALVDKINKSGNATASVI